MLAGSALDPDKDDGYLFVVLKPELLIDPDDFKQQISALIDRITATPGQPGVDEIRIPGKRTFRSREQALRDGIAIDRVVTRGSNPFTLTRGGLRVHRTGMESGRLSWLFAPWHVAALATGAKSFRDNPVIGSPALNRTGLHIARVRLAHQMSKWRRQRLSRLISGDDRAAFERDGFVLKPDFLPAAAFAALKEQVLSFRGPVRHQLQGDAMTRRIALDHRTLARLPALRGLVESPEWLGLVRYVGSYMLEPLVYIQTIFSHVRQAPPDPQTRLHADAFHPSVKAWFFLTDVAEEDGPFIYVPGSHRPTRRRLSWERRVSMTAARSLDFQAARGSLRIMPETVRRLGFGEPKAFAVPQNTLVVADTVGFHARGLSARPSVRVEIWAYGRRNPFLPWLGFDLAGLPFVKGRAVPLYWSAMDVAERLHLSSNPWRSAGTATPIEYPAAL